MKSFSVLSAVLLASASAFSQVQLDKPVQLSGIGSDAKIEGIKSVTDDHDAANKKYVDDAIGTIDGSETIIQAGTNITVDGSGTAAAPYVIHSGSGGSGRYIGEEYGGGVVFHLWKDGGGTEHGLIVAITETTAVNWSNVTNVLIGPAAQSSWDGLGNSNAIVSQPGHTASAAQYCIDLVSGAQSDWYLPSIDELRVLWHNRLDINRTLSGIAGETLLAHETSLYWSSTEGSDSAAWNVSFVVGPTSSPSGKNQPNRRVRAVRAF
jgi:hypothetical protein